MQRQLPILGIALMVLSTAVLSTKDGLAKTFLDQVGPMQMIWVQYAGMFLVMAVVLMPAFGWRILQPQPLGLQFVRGALSAAAIASLYAALAFIPLADAIAMFMFAPAVVTLLSPYLLGERSDMQRKLAVLIGFLGVIVILKPGFRGDIGGYAFALLAGVLMALHYIANRRLAGTQPMALNVAHNALMGALAMTLFLPLYWELPPAAAIPKLTAFVLLAVVGQGLMIASFNYAPAAVVAPYSYAMLVFAIVVGYAMFGAIPDVAGWCGIALIIASGLYIANHERRLAGALRNAQ